LSQLKKYHPSENLKFNNLSHFSRLEISYFNGKNTSNFSQAKLHSKYFRLLSVKEKLKKLVGQRKRFSRKNKSYFMSLYKRRQAESSEELEESLLHQP